jgi:hypothetical protein
VSPQPTALRETLDSVVGPTEFGADTILDEALAFISQRYSIAIVIDEDAFLNDRDAPRNEVPAQKIKLARLTGIKLRTVLRKVLAQVDADFIQQDGVVVVVPRSQMAPEAQLERRVDAVFNREPLSMALQKLADRSGVSVVLDGRAGEDTNTPVTATFMSVPVETAVRVLANMAGMKSVAIENVLYVTSRENASNLQEEQEQRKLRMRPTGPGLPASRCREVVRRAIR